MDDESQWEYTLAQVWWEDGEECYHFLDGYDLEHLRSYALGTCRGVRVDNSIYDIRKADGSLKFYNEPCEVVETYKEPDGDLDVIIRHRF